MVSGGGEGIQGRWWIGGLERRRKWSWKGEATGDVGENPREGGRDPREVSARLQLQETKKQTTIKLK